MNKYKEQFHPFYDAAVLLNPYIENDRIDVEDAIEYIESKMKSIGYKEGDQEKSPN